MRRLLRIGGIVLLVLFLLLPLMVGIYAAGNDEHGPGQNDIPTLFYNDTVWVMDRYYPALGFVTGNTDDFWIPLAFFAEMENIKVRRVLSKNVTSFVISDADSGKYLSFNTTVDEYAQTERGTRLYVRTMLYSKERYLPMRDMCLYFGWDFEISEDKQTVRILDGGEKKTFASLLAQYAPPETSAPDDSGQTEDAGDVGDTPGKNVYRADTVYLTFEDIRADYTPALLDILAEYGVKATFFVTGEQLISETDIVTRILAEGHALGLHTMSDDEYALTDIEAILDSLERENALLYALTKRKTRLVRLPEGSHSGVLYLTERQKARIAEEGYVLWDWNIASMDTSDAYDADRILDKIEAAMKISYNPVVRFHNTAMTVEVLPRLLARIEEVPVIGAKKITEATANVVFP